MDEAAILRLLDAERQTVADSDCTLEKTPYVVRAVGAKAGWNGIVYSRFSPSETARIVQAEIEYFTRMNRDFEWKVYSHDKPPDLLMQLRNCGFRIGEEESLMIRDLVKLPPPLLVPPPEGVTVRPVRDQQSIADFLSLESAIWSCEPNKTRELLLLTLSDPFQHEPFARLDRWGLLCLIHEPNEEVRVLGAVDLREEVGVGTGAHADPPASTTARSVDDYATVSTFTASPSC